MLELAKPLTGAIVVLALIASCTGDEKATVQDEGITPEETQPAIPAPTASATEENAVLAAYSSYWDGYRKALFDLDISALYGLAEGEQLERIRKEIEDLRANGLAGRIEMNHNPVVLDVSDNTAVVFDEMTNNSFYVDAVTKEPPIASGSGETLRDTLYLERVNDVWVVTHSVRETGEAP